MKFTLLLAAFPMWVALISIAHAQDSAATATMSLRVTPSVPAGFSWIAAGSYSHGETSAAAFDRWQFVGLGGYVPLFGVPSKSSDLQGGAWPNSSATLSTSGLNFSSSFALAPTPGFALLLTNAVVRGGGTAHSQALMRSYFSLAPGASVTFAGGVTLSVFGQNPTLPGNYATDDLYGFASGSLSVEGGASSEAETGNATLPYAAGAYSFNQVAPLSVSFTNFHTDTLVAYLDVRVAVYTASAVPEPRTYALMLAGLSGIFLAARRRVARNALQFRTFLVVD